MAHLRRLDDKQRARVVQLVERDKLSQAVVVERFGISYPTIAKILKEARAARSANAQG